MGVFHAKENPCDSSGDWLAFMPRKTGLNCEGGRYDSEAEEAPEGSLLSKTLKNQAATRPPLPRFAKVLPEKVMQESKVHLV